MSQHSPKSHHHADVTRARCYVLSISDSRSMDTDETGQMIAELLREHGHEVWGRELVRDELEVIRAAVLRVVEQGNVDVVVTTGGTGLAPRDVTPEAIEPLLSRRLDGFGEAFRRRSFEEVGPKGLLSRALAGTVHHTLVFALPGSPRACRQAIVELVAPLLHHAVGLVRKHATAKEST